MIKKILAITFVPGLLLFSSGCMENGRTLPRGETVIIRPDPGLDLAQGTVRFWHEGGRLVGGKTILQIGHPNSCRRGDRALIRFDLRQFIAEGKINKAEFLFTISDIYGSTRKRILQLDCIKNECATLIHADITSEKAGSVCRLEIENPPMSVAIDVTKAVNAALFKGYGSITFRLKDPDAERLGNPENIPTGSGIPVSSIRLEIGKRQIKESGK